MYAWPTGTGTGNNLDQSDATLHLIKILRDLVCCVTSDKLVSSKSSEAIGIIHDSRHVGFEIVMEISHVLCWGANIRKRANCGKSARRNIEITLLKVHFSI